MGVFGGTGGGVVTKGAGSEKGRGAGGFSGGLSGGAGFLSGGLSGVGRRVLVVCGCPGMMNTSGSSTNRLELVCLVDLLVCSVPGCEWLLRLGRREVISPGPLELVVLVLVSLRCSRTFCTAANKHATYNIIY